MYFSNRLKDGSAAVGSHVPSANASLF